MTDSAALTDAERRVLSLLAAGHTAKSIAAEVGRSVHWVNDRLREARRKTGAGSSRELARSLAATGSPQETGSEQIGVVGTGRPVEAGRAASPRRAGRLVGGLLVMILVALAGLAAMLASRPGQPTPADDPLLHRLLADAGPSDLRRYALVRTQTPDPAWDDAAEAVLRARYGAVLGTEKGLRVRCAATLCEVAGTIAGNSERTVAVQRLGLVDLPRDRLFGFTSFTVGPGSSGFVFVAYPTRLGGGAGQASSSPRVVATVPAQGARIAPGPFRLSVTFDRPMAPDSYSFTSPQGAAAFPDCPGKPGLSADGRTFGWSCRAVAGRTYVVGFNGGRFRNFVGAADGVAAEPSTLRFSVQ